jgi:hypothetical protein
MNDVKIKECGFSADMVPYMYAELPAAKSVLFEDHLLKCTTCTDEFASLSTARYEVYDWKKLEFDKIPTPAFATALKSELAPTTSSWTDRVRAAFSAGWAVPGVAFAALAIVSIFAAIFVSSGGDDMQIAAKDISNTAAETELVKERTEDSGRFEHSEPIDKTAIKSAGPVVASAPSAAPRADSRKAALRRTKATSRSYEFTQASARNVSKKILRLNEFAEDEDNSLRLTELFDDLEARN